MVTCEHIKANGQQCRGTAIWGLEPPRCPVHRQDGGPGTFNISGTNLTYLKSNLHFANNKRFKAMAQDDAHKLANLFLAANGLRNQLQSVPENDLPQAIHLIQLMSSNLTRIITILHRNNWQLPPGTEQLTEKWLALIEKEKETAKNEIERQTNKTLYRSPAYWAVYHFVEDFIQTYHYAPTYKEIQKGVGLPSKGTVNYWIAQLIRDGLLEKRGRIRGLRLR